MYINLSTCLLTELFDSKFDNNAKNEKQNKNIFAFVPTNCTAAPAAAAGWWLQYPFFAFV